MDMRSGYFFINKERGMTSFDVDKILKKKFNLSKIGHVGTLDPFATGLQIIMVNEATKTLFLFDECSKTYRAKLKLFVATDTLDNDGNIIEVANKKTFNKKEIAAVLDSFLGKSEQIPPVFSAIKVNGVPSYKLARQGKNPILKAREIDIKNIKLLNFEDDVIEFLVTVSKGTYIRSLGLDIAHRLGTIGHLFELERVAIGEFKLSCAKNILEVMDNDLITIEQIELGIPKIKLDEKLFLQVKNGQMITLDCDSKFVELLYKDKIVAIYYKKDNHLYASKRGFQYGNN